MAAPGTVAGACCGAVDQTPSESGGLYCRGMDSGRWSRCIALLGFQILQVASGTKDYAYAAYGAYPSADFYNDVKPTQLTTKWTIAPTMLPDNLKEHFKAVFGQKNNRGPIPGVPLRYVLDASSFPRLSIWLSIFLSS